jgi:putative hydrolase of the HAD superfamily
MAIEAVVFDWAGVLAGPPVTDFAEFEARLGVPAGSMPELLGLQPYATDGANMWHQRELGRASALEWAEWYVGRIVAAGGPAIPPELFVESERDRFAIDPNPVVIDAVQRLKANGYRLAICTNNFIETGDVWRSRLPIELFDAVVASCDVGLRKPDPAMFEYVSAQLATGSGSTILLDDFAANVEGARAAGWQSILVADHVAAIAELDALL